MNQTKQCSLSPVLTLYSKNMHIEFLSNTSEKNRNVYILKTNHLEYPIVAIQITFGWHVISIVCNAALFA